MTARKPFPVDLIDALLVDYKKPEDRTWRRGKSSVHLIRVKYAYDLPGIFGSLNF